MNYFNPYKKKQHSRLNCWVSRQFLRVQYYWNKYILRRKIIPLHTSVALSYGMVEHLNWGDDLNLFFLRKISKDFIMPYAYSCYPNGGSLKELKKEPLYSAIGSVLSWIPKENTIVWGTGLIDGQLPPFDMKVYAVRGPKTREKLIEQGVDCPQVYGDPALLLPLYYRPSSKKKKYKLGIVPHYTEYYSTKLDKFKQDPNIIVIKMFDYKHWTDIIDQICSCNMIVSSSLHGLIVSEAYSIPNFWVEIDGPIISDKSRRFKFYDFYSSIEHDDISPFQFEEKTTISDVLNMAPMYKKGVYDITGLFKACPWRLKSPLYKNVIKG